jgi:hypothetical protein
MSYTFEMEYIYLLQEREFIKTNENIFKIGRTKQQSFRRFSSYPKGSKLLLYINCDDNISKEYAICCLFKQHYKHRLDIGNEYYEGNYKNMINDIVNIINLNNDTVIDSNTAINDDTDENDDDTYEIKSNLGRIYDNPKREPCGYSIYLSGNKPNLWMNKQVIEKVYKNGGKIITLLEKCLFKYYITTFNKNDYVSYSNFNQLLILIDCNYKIYHDLELVDMVIRKQSNYTFKSTDYNCHDDEGHYVIRGLQRKPAKQPFGSIIDNINMTLYNFNKKYNLYICNNGISKINNKSFDIISDNYLTKLKPIVDIIKNNCQKSDICINSYGLKHLLEKLYGSYISNGECILCCLSMGVKYNKPTKEYANINLYIEIL